MKTLLVYFLVIIPMLAQAQRTELKKYCTGLDQIFHSEKAFHLSYQLTVKSKEDPSVQESMLMHLYKKGQSQKLIMGEAQEVLQKGSVMLVANHVQKLLMVQDHPSMATEDHTLLADLSELADSAATVTAGSKGGIVTYTLSFSQEYIYRKVLLSFNEKTKTIAALYAEFATDYPDYHSIKVDYQKWDMNWKPEDNFPGLDKYVVLNGKRYQPVQAWKSYQFFQPERSN